MDDPIFFRVLLFNCLLGGCFLGRLVFGCPVVDYRTRDWACLSPMSPVIPLLWRYRAAAVKMTHGEHGE